ncbi:MAG: hypothetical protein H6Q15_1156 [Bacteroidetes bacterium]|nr:hypothetical protein [Bacteroidota bacterium]
MDDAKYIEELLSLSIKEKIKKHSYPIKDEISSEELIKIIAKNLNFTEEKVRTILDLYVDELADMRLNEPEKFKRFIKERFNAEEENDEA